MDKYDKIASGLNDHYAPKAKKRMAERAEIQFNRSEGAYESALKSKDAEAISKVVNALIAQRQEIYNKIFSTGGSDGDIAKYKELTSKLEQLQYHVESLHDKGEI